MKDHLKEQINIANNLNNWEDIKLTRIVSATTPLDPPFISDSCGPTTIIDATSSIL